MRLGLIGGTDSKRRSGVYSLDDVTGLQEATKYLTGFGYDGVFNALSSSGIENGFDVSRNGQYVYVTVAGARTTATVFQYECSTWWDLSTISYTGKSLVVGDWELNCNGIAISDDGSKLFFTGTTGDTVWSATLTTPYDLATAVVDVRKMYVGTQNATASTPYFGDSGTKMYVLGTTGGTVYQYTLSSAWDVSTATYANKSLVVTGVDTTPTGLFFKDDGSKLYILGNTNDIVYSYTLSINWDVSTGVPDFVSKSYSVSTQVPANSFAGVALGDNGSKMYALAGEAAATDTIYQYTVNTAWDVRTAVYSPAKSFSVSAQDATTSGFFLKDDGTKLYVIGSTNDRVYQYTLSTAWDISTASYDSISFSVSAQELTPTGVFIGDGGTKMYVIGSTGDDVNQYALSTAWDISTASFVRVSATVGDGTPGDVQFKSDGTKMYIIGLANDAIREFTLSTAWDVSTISFSKSYFVGTFDLNATGLFFKPDGTEMYFSGFSTRTVYQLSLTTPWDSASVTGRFYVGNEESVPNALYIKPDGLGMYVIGQTGDDVNEYSLSTAWDIATANFVRVSAAIGEATPTGIWFKEDDGTKMFVTGSTTDTIREFNLSTAWDVSTISFSKSLSVQFETVPSGISFRNDGTIVYISGHTNDCVYGITLGTAWDIGTANGYIFVGGTENAPRGLHINSDGTLLYLTGDSNNIRKYTMSTAYELGTAALSQSFGLTGSYGIHVTSDGYRAYATTDSTGLLGGRQVRQINLTSPNDLSTATLSSTEIVSLLGLTGASVNPWGVRISPDGTRMFVLSDVIQGIYQFSLRFA